jgi:hypothetical protein
MTDLITRLLALAEKAVDEALQLDYGDPEDRYIYRELQELRQLVQQGRQTIKPVPVSERLPGPEDCDDSYQCWQWDAKSDSWTLYTSIGMGLNPLSTHWLPYHALPLPAK